ncbi:hypothetical protein AAG570_007009 [Ranatra chinensis]|uniref:Reverse transcriptase domain-containing protein n=1 Tax=Ranatra chinensis TaxID=642074 RepID=A0ABD0Z8C4_9HEMI
MESRDIEKTSFPFERGKYEFVRMPFGLKNAPITCRCVIDNLLLALDESYVQAYMDDLIIVSKEFGLRISGDKSYFGMDEAKFMALGAVLAQDGQSERPVAFASKKLTPVE